MPEERIPTDIAKRLKTIRHELGFKQEDFAERMGLNQNTLSQYENAKRKVPDSLKQQIADEFTINMDWLLTGRGDMEMNPDFVRSPRLDGEELVYVDILDVRASAGYGIENFDPEVKGRMALSSGVIYPYRSSQVKIFEVSGVSMEPTLSPGDQIMIVQGFIGGDGIYLLNRDHELYVKRIKFFPGSKKLTVISDNPDFDNIEIDGTNESVELIGKAIFQIRRFN